MFLGYYTLILLVVITCLFLVTGAWPRLFLAASGVLITLVLYYFLVDGVVYRILKNHIDAFWLIYLATTFEGLGIGLPQILLGLALLAGVAALEWWLFRLAARVQAPRRWVIGQAVACVLAYGVSQTLHLLAYGANDTRIAALTPQLPFYFPIVSHKHSEKYRDQLPMIGEASASGLGAEAGAFRYPLREVSCNLSDGHRRPNIVILLLESWRADALDSVVTPRMYAFSQRASRFLNHFSSGNSTPAGVFPVFYGIYPTYWTAVKANNALIHNPVLIDALEANGYSFGIYANSHFERHKVKDAVFRGIEVHESFEGATDDARDRDMTEQLLDFMEQSEGRGEALHGVRLLQVDALFLLLSPRHGPVPAGKGAERPPGQRSRRLRAGTERLPELAPLRGRAHRGSAGAHGGAEAAGRHDRRHHERPRRGVQRQQGQFLGTYRELHDLSDPRAVDRVRPLAAATAGEGGHLTGGHRAHPDAGRRSAAVRTRGTTATG